MGKDKKFPFTKVVMDEMEKTMYAQDEFGFKKYGQALDPMDDYDWLQMAEEELADMTKYFKAEQHKRDHLLRQVHKELVKMEYRAISSQATKTIESIQVIRLLIRKINPNLG